MTRPPQPPADLPPHISHGTSAAHSHYKCRCGGCQEWRRSYDRNRDQAIRKGCWKERRQGWYVCIDAWGEAWGMHRYTGFGTCGRCGASQQEEQYWEWKWKESKP